MIDNKFFDDNIAFPVALGEALVGMHSFRTLLTIRFLGKDTGGVVPKKSLIDFAKSNGLSESTVLSHVKHLIEKGFLKIHEGIIPSNLGDAGFCYFLPSLNPYIHKIITEWEADPSVDRLVPKFHDKISIPIWKLSLSGVAFKHAVAAEIAKFRVRISTNGQRKISHRLQEAETTGQNYISVTNARGESEKFTTAEYSELTSLYKQHFLLDVAKGDISNLDDDKTKRGLQVLQDNIQIQLDAQGLVGIKQDIEDVRIVDRGHLKEVYSSTKLDNSSICWHKTREEANRGQEPFKPADYKFKYCLYSGPVALKPMGKAVNRSERRVLEWMNEASKCGFLKYTKRLVVLGAASHSLVEWFNSVDQRAIPARFRYKAMIVKKNTIFSKADQGSVVDWKVVLPFEKSDTHLTVLFMVSDISFLRDVSFMGTIPSTGDAGQPSCEVCPNPEHTIPLDYVEDVEAASGEDSGTEPVWPLEPHEMLRMTKAEYDKANDAIRVSIARKRERDPEETKRLSNGYMLAREYGFKGSYMDYVIGVKYPEWCSLEDFEETGDLKPAGNVEIKRPNNQRNEQGARFHQRPADDYFPRQ